MKSTERRRSRRRENEWERVKETPKTDNSGSGGEAQTAFLFFLFFLFLIFKSHFECSSSSLFIYLFIYLNIFDFRIILFIM